MLATMKKAILEKQDLDMIELYNEEPLNKIDREKIAQKTSLTEQEVQIVYKAKGLMFLDQGLTKPLGRKEDFKIERELGDKFGKDTQPQDWPWSSVEKMRDAINEELWQRRTKLIKILFDIAQNELIIEEAKEKERVTEEKRIAALSKMGEGGKRKTLEWHREQIAKKKALEEKENEKINKKEA